MLVLLLACRSGVIHYPSGSDDLRAAWFQTAPYTGRSNAKGETTLTQTVVLLANTQVECEDIPTLDLGKEDALDSPETVAIFTRENARVVILFLFQHKDLDLVSTYVVDPEPRGKNVTTVNGVASAAYLGVNEAELVDEDGLVRFYLPGSNPGDCELVDQVPPPGEIVITHATDHLRGTFALDSIDVSGRFDAKECTDNPEFMNTLQSIVLLPPDTFSMCVDEPDETVPGD